MKLLFAARVTRYGLLRATQALASRVTKWSEEWDEALHRLVSYIQSSLCSTVRGFIGDKFRDCQLWLFADGDFAGAHDSKSTTGSCMVLVGPNIYFPVNAFSKKQTAVALSSTEAEVIAAKHSFKGTRFTITITFQLLACHERSWRTNRGPKQASWPPSQAEGHHSRQSDLRRSKRLSIGWSRLGTVSFTMAVAQH